MLENPCGQRPDLQNETMELEDGQAKKLFLVLEMFVFGFSGWPSTPKTLPRREVVRRESDQVPCHTARQGN